MILTMSVLAVIGAMPLFLLVASLSRSSVADAQRLTMNFLEQWGGVAPESLKIWVRKTIGGTVGFSLLVALSFGFNFLGDTNITPSISKAFHHFGYRYTEWSDNSERDWVKFRDSTRGRWVKAHADDDLMNDPIAWEKWKNDRGKDQVRIPRTLVWFSFILIMAGFVDILLRNFRRRGALLMFLGAATFIVLMYIWADRKNHYVHEVVLASETLGKNRVEHPPSLVALVGEDVR